MIHHEEQYLEKFDADAVRKRIFEIQQRHLEAQEEWKSLFPECHPRECFDRGEKFGLVCFKEITFDCPWKSPVCRASAIEKRYEANLITRSLLRQGVPEENAGFNLFTTSKYETEMIRTSIDYLPLLKSGNFLIIFGKTGTGKSSCAAGVCREFIRKQRESGKLEYELKLPVWSYSPDAVQAYEERFQNIESWSVLRKSMLNTNLLVIDDMGAEDNAAIERKIYAPVICKRADKNRATIITSQLSSALFQQRMGDRIASRVKQKGLIYRPTGLERDWRNTVPIPN